MSAGSGIAGNQGSSSFAALELLANPSQLQAKIDQLKAAEESARKQIDLAGPASEILQMRADIDGLKELAEDNYNGAKADAESLVERAREEAAQIVADAKADAERVSTAIQARAVESENAQNEAMATLAAAKKEETFLAQRAGQLSNERGALDVREADLDSLNSELLQEKSQLASIREQINSVLD